MLIFLPGALLARQQNMNRTQLFRTTAVGSTTSALREDDSQWTEGWHKVMRLKVQKSIMDSTEELLTHLWQFCDSTCIKHEVLFHYPYNYIHQ